MTAHHWPTTELSTQHNKDEEAALPISVHVSQQEKLLSAATGARREATGAVEETSCCKYLLPLRNTVMSNGAITTPSPALDLAASPLPGQVAFCVLDLKGNVVGHSTGSDDNKPPVLQDAPTLFQMLQEIVPVMPQKDGNQIPCGLRRMTIDFDNGGSGDGGSSTRYVLGRDDAHVYLIQTTSL